MAQEVQKTNHVVYRSSNGQLIDIYYMRQPNWRHTNHSVKNGAPSVTGKPSAFVYDVNNSQNVVFRGQDGHIQSLVFIRGEGWTNSNLTALTGAPPAGGDLSPYTYQAFNTRHVIYRSHDGHLHQLNSPPSGEWRHADMTVKHGAPQIVGKPSTYIYGINDSQNIVYRGQDGHVYHVYFVRGEGWTIKNLTGTLGIPTAVGDPSTYTYHVFDTQHVVYQSANGHLHQLNSPPGVEWRHADMTEKHGIPPISGKPAPFVDPVNNSQNIVYRGQDGHIHDVYFIRGEGWKHLNLSAMLGTPLAAGDPFAYTFDLFQTQHVVYRGQDGNMYQLYIPPGKEWRQSNLTAKTGAPLADSDPYCYTYDLK